MGVRATQLHLRFALPSSQGALKASTLSLQLGPWLRKILAPELSVEMHVAESYAALADDLRAGRADAAWAPPFVCAEVEREGGRWLARFERGGCTTFRAAFVCRVDHPLQLDALDRVKVAWVAPESTSGYLLPREWLARAGNDLKVAFGQELFAGSYSAALEALLAGKVDLTTVFASPAAAEPKTGLDKLPPALRQALQIVGYTHESPNDGIVVGPTVSEAVVELLRSRLTSPHHDAATQESLRTIFDAERLVP